ncbi:MAG: peptide chain release factor N(5)-glutamine methyltransferase [Vulcanimicrobiota bacterium]
MRTPTATTVGGALDEGARRLLSTRPRSPRLDAEMLLGHVLGLTRTELYARADQAVPASKLQDYRRLLDARETGVPVAYLVGWKEFYSRRFWVSPKVLIPRPETEVLVEEAMKVLSRQGLTRPRILDVGTGSGVLAITLALELPLAEVVAVDIESAAIEQALENARLHEVADRILFETCDLFEAVEGRFDLIVSNPPYVGIDQGPRPEVAVVKNEPHQALFAGSQGLDVIERLVAGAPRHLNGGGEILLECAPFQVERVEAKLVDAGFHQTRIIPDLSGLPRAVAGRWEEKS